MLGRVVARPAPERGGRYCSTLPHRQGGVRDSPEWVVPGGAGRRPRASGVRARFRSSRARGRLPVPVVGRCWLHRAGLQTAATVQHVSQFHVSPCSKRGARSTRRQQRQSWLAGASIAPAALPATTEACMDHLLERHRRQVQGGRTQRRSASRNSSWKVRGTTKVGAIGKERWACCRMRSTATRIRRDTWSNGSSASIGEVIRIPRNSGACLPTFENRCWLRRAKQVASRLHSPHHKTCRKGHRNGST